MNKWSWCPSIEDHLQKSCQESLPILTASQNNWAVFNSFLIQADIGPQKLSALQPWLVGWSSKIWNLCFMFFQQNDWTNQIWPWDRDNTLFTDWYLAYLSTHLPINIFYPPFLSLERLLSGVSFAVAVVDGGAILPCFLFGCI